MWLGGRGGRSGGGEHKHTSKLGSVHRTWNIGKMRWNSTVGWVPGSSRQRSTATSAAAAAAVAAAGVDPGGFAVASAAET